jgi:hypothetical protein
MPSIRVFTTSIPTPRPDTFVTAAIVENPGRKIMCMISRLVIVASCACEMRPRSILNVAGMGKFSIDRTVRDYNRDIWKAPFVPVTPP